MPAKNSGTFGYPGGKTTIAPWIVDHFSDHDIYVEPFGGSASVFMHKEPSETEVYNDLNQHCVTFFEAVKDHPGELAEWIRATPYSRELFNRWITQFKHGDTPDDPVEHAGRFWFVQMASFGGKIPSEGGSFAPTIKPRNQAQYGPTAWARKEKQTHNLAHRFRYVQIESQDYRDVIDRYDTADTLFYCDPPYVDVGDDYYTGADFDHDELAACLKDVSGRWILSYDELPEWCEGYTVLSRARDWALDADRDSTGTEKLVMNYDPETTPAFTPDEQTTVADF